MQKNPIFNAVILSLLCSGCKKKEKERLQQPSEILEEEKEAVTPIVNIKTKKKSIQDDWLKECSVSFSEKADCSTQLKTLAKSLGVNLSINKEIKLNYKARRKAFIDILLDISHAKNLMIKIKGLNANIEEDTPYLHDYYLGNLSSSIGTEFLTSVDHSFGDHSKDNVSKSFYKNHNSYYELIAQNLSSFIPKEHSFTINPQAGIITVVAPQKYQKKVSMHLNSIRPRLNDQILVEAKILEVELFSESSYGIDLEALKKSLIDNLNLKFVAEAYASPQISALTFFSTVGDAALKSSIFNFLSNYGEVSSISNPYLLVSNNHVGIFKATENKIYFKFKASTMFVGAKNDQHSVNRESDFVTYPVGVTFSVHAVKLEGDLIKLYLKPTITEVSKEIDDAGYTYVNNAANPKNNSTMPAPKVPIIKTRELESVLVLRNGQYAIIGGLIDKSSKSSKQPLKRSNEEKKTELIILLRVQSVDNGEDQDPYDFLVDF